MGKGGSGIGCPSAAPKPLTNSAQDPRGQYIPAPHHGQRSTSSRGNTSQRDRSASWLSTSRSDWPERRGLCNPGSRPNSHVSVPKGQSRRRSETSRRLLTDRFSIGYRPPRMACALRTIPPGWETLAGFSKKPACDHASRSSIVMGVVHGAVTGSSFDLHRKLGTWGATVTYRIMDAEPPGAAGKGHSTQAEAHHGPCSASNWGMLGQALHHMVQGRRRPEKRGEG